MSARRLKLQKEVCAETRFLRPILPVWDLSVFLMYLQSFELSRRQKRACVYKAAGGDGPGRQQVSVDVCGIFGSKSVSAAL